MEGDVSGPVAVQATGLAERRIRTEGSHSGNCITSHIEQTRSDNALFPKRPSLNSVPARTVTCHLGNRSARVRAFDNPEGIRHYIRNDQGLSRAFQSW